MINISFEVIAVLALATALIALGYTFSQNLRLRARLAQQEGIIDAVQNDLSAMCSGAIGLGEHMVNLEQRASQLHRRQEKIESQSPSSKSYRVAENMLRKGARIEEVMADCGMTRGEADLIAFAQRIRKAS